MAEVRSSTDRVQDAARELGLEIEIRHMPASTRTAAEAAGACGCDVSQIVKSMVFATEDHKDLVLLLVSGADRVDTKRAEEATGHKLDRADPQIVRQVTGFAIGGVAPIGHVTPLPVYVDRAVLEFDEVWAAGGGPQTVFAVDPRALADRIGATVADLT